MMNDSTEQKPHKLLRDLWIWFWWSAPVDFVRVYRVNRDPRRGPVRSRQQALHNAWHWVREWRWWRAAP